MLPLARVGVFVARATIKPIQPAFVFGEMRRHPIQNHADARLVAYINKMHELVWRAIARGGGVIPGHLIPPRAVIRMLHHRQQLDMGVSHLDHIRHQLLRQLVIIESLAVGIPPPGAEMHFVNVDRLVVNRVLTAALLPRRILPVVSIQMVDLGRGGRAGLKMIGIRIRFQHSLAVRRLHTILVGIVFLQPADRCLPHAVGAAGHGGGILLPIVEVAHHRYTGGVRRPHAKYICAIFQKMTTHLFKRSYILIKRPIRYLCLTETHSRSAPSFFHSSIVTLSSKKSSQFSMISIILTDFIFLICVL